MPVKSVKINRKDARLIFEGTVKGPGNRPNSVVARVDALKHAPDALADLAGQDVTVWLGEGEKVAKGERAVFYANPVQWGQSIAVRSLGHDAAERPLSGRRGAAPVEPLKSAAEQQLEEQVSNADLVVTGKVAQVRLPAEERPSMRRAAAAEAEPRRISEHDPMWREAVIEVQDVHKGGSAREVVVRFPKSNDVRWRTAPKFEAGQQGVFLLQKEALAPGEPPPRAPKRAGASAALVAPAVAYTALNRTDFQPIDRVEGIKTLIRAGRK